MRTTRSMAAILLAAALHISATAARADDYPNRPVTLIVPYPAGGGADAVGRLMALKLSAALGQQVIVENRPGAGSVIGTRAAAKAAPDGYTIAMVLTGISLPASTSTEGVQALSTAASRRSGIMSTVASTRLSLGVFTAL